MASKTLDDLPAASSVAGGDYVLLRQGGVSKKATATQIAGVGSSGVTSVNTRTGAVTLTAADVGVSGTNTGDETTATIKSKLGITTLSGSNTGDQTSVTGNAGTVTNGVYTTDKDASGGVPGLTLFKLNLRNAANTVTSWFTTAATAARTWTMPDASGTVALTSDITGTNSGTNTGDNAVNSLYSGLVSNATHTGDATGATALTVVKINGTLMSGLATGILKNTTGTGVPSIAVAADFPTLNQSTTGNAATATALSAGADRTKLDGIASGATANTGTVTSVAALTLGTTGTDLSSSVATGTTTPVITLNVPTASASNRGALSAADWSTFNAKAPTANPTFTGYQSFSGGTGFSLPTAAGTNEIKPGTGDGASTTTYNVTIRSWWGIGFRDYTDGTTVKAYIDCRSGIFSGTQLQSLVATGTAPLVVASTTVTTNLNADLLDGQHGSYYAPVANATLTGATVAQDGIRIGASAYPTYETNLDFGADVANTWRKVVTVALANAIYSTHGFVIEILDPLANYATQGSPSQVISARYYVACVRTEALTLDTPDLCVVRGPSSHVRAVKTSTGNYEIQVQNSAQWQELRVRITTYAVNDPGHTITYNNGSAAGSAGTAQYAASVGNAVDWFQNVKATKYESTVATGTAPLTVASTTKVTNLNADLLDGVNLDTAYNSFGNDTIPRRHSAGYLYSNYFNCVADTNAIVPTKVAVESYVNDSFIRWQTWADFKTNIFTGYTYSGTLTSGQITTALGYTPAAGGGLAASVIGTNTTAVSGTVYVFTASLVLTLPASPTAGNVVRFSDMSGTITSTIGRNGQNIMSIAQDMTLDRLYANCELMFADATRGWILV